LRLSNTERDLLNNIAIMINIQALNEEGIPNIDRKETMNGFAIIGDSSYSGRRRVHGTSDAVLQSSLSWRTACKYMR
jgi:hypothetical protein